MFIRHKNQFLLKCLMLGLLFINVSYTNAQLRHQELRIFCYNVSFGGLTGAIGSMINKTSKNEPRGKTILRGFWQGCIGGSMNYASKKSVSLITTQDNLFYAFNSRFLNNIGCSIIESASTCKPFLQNWHFIYGPVRFDFDLSKKNRNFKVRFMPMSIVSLLTESYKTKFDLRTSLITGTFAFKGDTNYINRFGLAGSTTMWGISYAPIAEKNAVIAHELIHTFQYHEYLVVNTYFNKLNSTRLLQKNKKIVSVLQNYIYLDIPYFDLAYAIEGYHPPATYYKNRFEMEASWCAGF